MWKLKATDSVPSGIVFLSKAGNIFEKYSKPQNSIVFQALRTMVYEKIVVKKNASVEPKLVSFYSYLHALNPISCQAVSGSLGG